LPLGEDLLFHFIDDEGNQIGTAPILTYNELVIVLPEIQISANPSVSALASSFNKKLLSQNDKQKSIILKYFADSLELFKTANRFYAPFVTICQSSGVGKSRFVLECGEDIPLVYGVFRAESDKGYPRMSDWIKSFVDYVIDETNKRTDSFPVEENCGGLIAESYSVGRVLIYIEALLVAYKALHNQLSFNGKCASEVFKEINLKFHTPEGHSEFASLIKVKSNLTFDQVFQSLRHITNDFLAQMPEKHSKAPFVVVFDELSLLLEIDFPKHINLFHIIRRALHLFPTENPINLLIVGIGTNGDVSIFHKEITDDSLRILDKNLFLPSLILGSNWDIFKKFIDLKQFKLTPKNVKNSKMIKLLCSFGRALWPSLPFVSIIPVAQKKLRNGVYTKSNTSLAIWSIRTSLSLNSDLMLARTLLRSYMAVAYSISYNAETMNIGYPSEPILAVAARDFMNSYESFYFKKMLDELLDFVQCRPVDKGELTEIIFSQIVLMAIDKSENVASKTNDAMACDENDGLLNQIFNSEVFLLESLPDKVSSSEMDIDSTSDTGFDSRPVIQNFYHITTVKSFLLTLYGDIKGTKISNSLGECLSNGIINGSHVISAFNKFPYQKVYTKTEIEILKSNNVTIEDEVVDDGNGKRGEWSSNCVIDQAILRNLFLRQAVLKTPPGYFGLDMCIPVLMRRPNDNESDEGVFGYIGLQYKTTYESEGNVIPKMDPKLHYVRCEAHMSCDCNTNDSDFTFVHENHLLLYLAASYVEEKQCGGLGKKTQPERECKTNASGILENMANMESEPVQTHQGVPYYVTRSIYELSEGSKVLGLEECRSIQKIIHAQNDPFRSADPFQARKVADNVLTMSPLRYPEADGDLRSARGLQPLSDPFFHDKDGKWSNNDAIRAYIEESLSRTSAKSLSKGKNYR